ncbi:MAG: hypothetical protein JSV30_04000 [Candidatus Omnitrophota bacterium]|nr:MAG: hypothetical protein JSV30_04000 [Candidatus Omnitrophota bacterium]
MKALRWLIAGLIWGIFSNVIHGIVNGGIFKDWYVGYEHLYRSFDSTMMTKLILLSIVMGLVLSFLYLVIHRGIPGNTPAKKGFIFGVLLFLPQLVGLFFQHTMSAGPFPLPCLISGIIATPVGGVLIALIYGKRLN